MRQSSQIAVTRTIVHLVSPDKPAPTLSQRALPTNRMGALHEFLAGHIENSLQDEDTKTARFVKDAEDSVVYSALPGVSGSATEFTEATQRIASHLHSVVSADKRVSPGALVCCAYTANTPRLRDTEFLALLKLDPTDGYQPQTKVDSKGRRYVTLSVLNDIVPTTRERLQKCAFIRTQHARGLYNLLVLDRQGRAREAVAAFFVDKFLKATLVGDPVGNTRGFWLGAWKGLSGIEAEIGPKRTAQVRKAMHVALHSPRIDVDSWVKSLPIEEAHQGKMLAALMERLDDRTIRTDPETADRMTRKSVYRGEGGFKLSFDSQYEDEIVKSPPKPVNDPQYGQVYELTLRVRGLEQVRS